MHLLPFRESEWVDGWTIFYWAWWISRSPFADLFIARVSRGRTIYEFIVGTVLVPSFAAFIWFSEFGGTVLNMEIWHGVPIAHAAREDMSTALFVMFDAMPLGLLMSGLAIIPVFPFFVTSGDSATRVLGMMSTGGNPDPSAKIMIMWGVLMAGIALSLLLADGLEVVQAATIVFALPFMGVSGLMGIALCRGIRDDWNEEQRKERDLRRRMRQMVGG